VSVVRGAAAAAGLAPALAACGKSDGWLGWSAAGRWSAALFGLEMMRKTLLENEFLNYLHRTTSFCNKYFDGFQQPCYLFLAKVNTIFDNWST
jgi:hypothetical protein